jgi:hypothetical protein
MGASPAKSTAGSKEAHCMPSIYPQIHAQTQARIADPSPRKALPAEPKVLWFFLSKKNDFLPF